MNRCNRHFKKMGMVLKLEVSYLCCTSLLARERYKRTAETFDNQRRRVNCCTTISKENEDLDRKRRTSSTSASGLLNQVRVRAKFCSLLPEIKEFCFSTCFRLNKCYKFRVKMRLVGWTERSNSNKTDETHKSRKRVIFRHDDTRSTGKEY